MFGKGWGPCNMLYHATHPFHNGWKVVAAVTLSGWPLHLENLEIPGTFFNTLKYLENSFFHIFTLKYLELYLACAPTPPPANLFIYPKSHIDKIPHFSCSYADLCFRIILSCYSFMVSSDIWKNCLINLKIPGKYL